jgi:hypothetical protein
LAAAAFAKMLATRRHTQRGWLDNAYQARTAKAFLDLRQFDFDLFPDGDKGHKHNEFSGPSNSFAAESDVING